MRLYVTGHAIQRYAQRVLGVEEVSPSLAAEIRRLISQSLSSASVCVRAEQHGDVWKMWKYSEGVVYLINEEHEGDLTYLAVVTAYTRPQRYVDKLTRESEVFRSNKGGKRRVEKRKSCGVGHRDWADSGRRRPSTRELAFGEM